MRSLLVLATSAVVCLGVASAGRADVITFYNTGCTLTDTPATGCLLTANVKGPGFPGDLPRGSKEGKACGYNILALFAWGDLRISTAMKDGAITEVSSVDSESYELVPGFYGFGRYCTVVTGE